MVYFGGSLIREIVEEIRDGVREYYGQINELRMGARSKPPERPSFMSAYEAYKRFKAMPFAGGFSDQPYMWVIEYTIIESEVEFMEQLAKQSMKT